MGKSSLISLLLLLSHDSTDIIDTPGEVNIIAAARLQECQGDSGQARQLEGCALLPSIPDNIFGSHLPQVKYLQLHQHELSAWRIVNLVSQTNACCDLMPLVNTPQFLHASTKPCDVMLRLRTARLRFQKGECRPFTYQQIDKCRCLVQSKVQDELGEGLVSSLHNAMQCKPQIDLNLQVRTSPPSTDAQLNVQIALTVFHLSLEHMLL